MMQNKIELFGSRVSPYTEKIEVYLKHKGLIFHMNHLERQPQHLWLD